jgi:hypothetical protein
LGEFAMAIESNIELVIDFIDTDDEKRDQAVLRLLDELRDIDEVESAGRVIDPNPPKGVLAGEGFLVGLLKTEVSFANFKKLMDFLKNRISNKSIKMKIKASNGTELELETSNQKDFEFAMQQAMVFLGTRD